MARQMLSYGHSTGALHTLHEAAAALACRVSCGKIVAERVCRLVELSKLCIFGL